MAAIAPETEVITPITVVGLAPAQEEQWWASWDHPIRLGDCFPPTLVAALRAGEQIQLDRSQLPICSWRPLLAAQTSLMTPMHVGEKLMGVLRMDYGAVEHDYHDQQERALIQTVARLGALVLERERLLCERAEARANALALREANAQMDVFLGIAGHELKSPLTSMKLGLQLAERRIRQLTQRGPASANEVESFLELVTRAERQAERLDRLVNDLLDVARVRVGQLDLRPSVTDLVGIIREAIEEQRQAAPTRTLLFQFPPGLRAPIVADAGRIGQVVTNYLTNALKYSPADRPVAVGLDMAGQQARVWVRDEGPGLLPEEQAQIWECFYWVEGIEVQSGSGVGLGLGLHICRTIIERHQGKVGVESAPGKGSTFWFTLPLAPAKEV